MKAAFYRSGRLLCKLVKLQCIREVLIGAGQAEREGGVILACTHLSHLEPFVVSCVVRRQIRWMARKEFYRPRLAAAVLILGGAFPVDRFGYSLPAVRKAIGLVRAGDVVGMFPEGGVAQGSRSVLRGASIKQGVCTIAIETSTPVIPVVVLGTTDLNTVGPWLPFKRARVWMAFGNPVLPPKHESRKLGRVAMAASLQQEFVRTYQHLLTETGLRDDQIP